MDFQRLLLDVGNSLSGDEVKALAFLCTDLLARNPISVESASDLFSRLADQDHLSAEQTHLLAELLLIIQRPNLARHFNPTDRQPATRSFVSAYRKLLYELSEEITDNDLKNIKFLLNKTLPRRKLEEHVTTLEVFLELEHMDHLSDTNLTELETIVQSVCPVLKEKISQFKEQQERQARLIAQETGEPMSMTFPPNQSFNHETTPSREIRVEQFRNSPNTSMDEAPPQESSRLSAETESFASLTVRSDAVRLFPKKIGARKQDTKSETLGSYSMTAAKRGVCLIINNYNFKENLRTREGTVIDEQCLYDVFKWLGFKTEIHRDCTSDVMRRLLQQLGRRDHSEMDSVACCILSHGQEGSVFGVDGNTVQLTELCQPLNGLRCSSLADKPKLFFIQACQGSNEQPAVYIESDGHTDSFLFSDAVAMTESIPSDADFLLAMSTVRSFVSFRDKRSGSWFIQSLCQNLVQMVPRGCDLVSILTKVNADVSQKTDSTGVKKQMPQPHFTLRKKVVFPVPTAPPPSLPSF